MSGIVLQQRPENVEVTAAQKVTFVTLAKIHPWGLYFTKQADDKNESACELKNPPFSKMAAKDNENRHNSGTIEATRFILPPRPGFSGSRNSLKLFSNKSDQQKSFRYVIQLVLTQVSGYKCTIR